MNKNLKIIKKIHSLSLVGLFAFIFLSAWFPVLRIVSDFCCCTLYITSFLQYKVETKKHNWLLLISCLLAVAFVVINCFYTIPFGKTIGMFFIYMYLNISSKVKTNVWNKWFIGIGVVGVIASFLNAIIDTSWIFVISILLQIYLIFKYLDPILEKMALEHRAKRLGTETASENELSK